MYFLFIGLAGFFVLLILSILAFANVQALKIKEGNNVASGVILLITAFVSVIEIRNYFFIF
jgi:hypothetical protein